MRWSLIIDVDKDVAAGVLEGEVHGGVEVPHVEAPGGECHSLHQFGC